MTATTVEELAAANGWEVVDFATARPAQTVAALPPILCRGWKCQCRTTEGQWRLVGGYDTHVDCGHTKQVHTAPKAAGAKPMRRQR